MTAHTGIIVTPTLGNPIGSIHGGAAVVLSAHVAEMALASRLSSETEVHATQIRANLLAGIPTTKGHKASVMATVSKSGHAWHATADITLNHSTAIDSQVWFHVD
jgi:acyl-coenzyme A thioesterase PaaI-like protein